MHRVIGMMLLGALLVGPVAAETVGYWTFEENGGQYAHCAPAILNGLTLRLGSSDSDWQDPNWSSAGYSGNCLHFLSIVGGPDGAIDILRPNSAADVSAYNTDTFTVEAWIKLDTIPDTVFDYYNPYTIFSFGGTDTEAANKDVYFLRVTARGDGTGILNGYFYDDADNGHSITHSAILVPGQWYHVAYAHDGSSTTDNISIWVDGVEETASSTTHPRTDLTLTGESLCVGSLWTRKRSMDGYIDEVRFSDTKLTTGELLLNNPPQRETLAYWRFEEQAGQVVHCEPGMTDLNLRRGTSDSDWHDFDWVSVGKSGGCVMCYSDIDTGALGYMTTDAGNESKVWDVMTDSFTIEAWINPEYIPLLNQAGTGPEFGFYDPFSIFDIKEWDEGATVTGDASLFCLLRFMPNATGDAGRLEAIWYDGDGDRTILHNSTDIPEQQWTHIAFAFDGTKGVDNATLFVNGVGTTWTALQGPRRDQITPKVTVGGMYAGSYVKRGFWGKVDEVRITNQALAADELLLPENAHGLDAEYLKGDLNKDLYVDWADLTMLVNNWLVD